MLERVAKIYLGLCLPLCAWGLGVCGIYLGHAIALRARLLEEAEESPCVLVYLPWQRSRSA